VSEKLGSARSAVPSGTTDLKNIGLGFERSESGWSRSWIRQPLSSRDRPHAAPAPIAPARTPRAPRPPAGAVVRTRLLTMYPCGHSEGSVGRRRRPWQRDMHRGTAACEDREHRDPQEGRPAPAFRRPRAFHGRCVLRRGALVQNRAREALTSTQNYHETCGESVQAASAGPDIRSVDDGGWRYRDRGVHQHRRQPSAIVLTHPGRVKRLKELPKPFPMGRFYATCRATVTRVCDAHHCGPPKPATGVAVQLCAFSQVSLARRLRQCS
jgi:hypothetical protein